MSLNKALPVDAKEAPGVARSLDPRLTFQLDGTDFPFPIFASSSSIFYPLPFVKGSRLFIFQRRLLLSQIEPQKPSYSQIPRLARIDRNSYLI